MVKVVLRLRSLLRRTYLSFFGKFKVPSKNIHILNGHFVDLSSNPSKKNFRNYLEKLRKSYDFIDFDKACKLIQSNKKVNKPLLAFSFDDGFKECSEIIAPCLNEYGIKAAFFINSFSINASQKEKINFFKNNLNVDYYKPLMNWDDISSLKDDGHVIGNHTHMHSALINLGYEESYFEISKCKDIIENKLKCKCEYFAFPFGSSNFFDNDGLDAATDLHKFVFTSGGYNKFFFKNLRNVFSRRHFEANWPINHLNYFLSTQRNY